MKKAAQAAFFNIGITQFLMRKAFFNVLSKLCINVYGYKNQLEHD